MAKRVSQRELFDLIGDMPAPKKRRAKHDDLIGDMSGPARRKLQDVLKGVKNKVQRDITMCLMQRYGVQRPADLLGEQVAPFTAELIAVLAGKAPHPATAILDYKIGGKR